MQEVGLSGKEVRMTHRRSPATIATCAAVVLLIGSAAAAAAQTSTTAEPEAGGTTGGRSPGGMQELMREHMGQTDMPMMPRGMHGPQGMRDGGCSMACPMAGGGMAWMMAGWVIFGILLIAALVLLIVLEVLWIRVLARRLKPA
jgi:uncharacterized membrane protein